MTSTLLTADPALLSLILGVWIWAAVRVGWLPYAENPRALGRRCRKVLVLIGVGLLLAVLRIALVASLASASWWFAQEKLVLSLPLLLVGCVATVAVTVPRVRALRSAARAFNGVNAMPPALRRDAAHPLVAWPVQVTALAAAAGMVVFALVSYPATLGSSMGVVTTVALVAAVGWSLLARRHRRLGADAVVVPKRPIRLVRSTGTVAALSLFAVMVGLVALVATAPSATAHGPTHQENLDLGGGSTPVERTVPDSSVDRMRTQAGDEAVRRFTLTARHAQLSYPSGSTVDALTFNGTVPGPELRVNAGELVEVTLRNHDISEGVTIHWHGYDVPNGEDGVAGVTQDSVAVGSEFVYRFRADQVGTYWYHSHQHSNEQVNGGLFGVLVVTAAAPSGVDLAVPHHFLRSGPITLMGSAEEVRREVAPGTPVRLRIVNASSNPGAYQLQGTTAAMVALDGTDVVGPGAVPDPFVRLAAGGRADLGFTMPATGVRLRPSGGPELVLRAPGGGEVVPGTSTVIDPLHYGTPAPTPFGPDSPFQRHFVLVLDQKLARLRGAPTFAYTVNGNAFPEIPTQFVRYGELVKFTFVGRGSESHPIHPHGHHVLVLSRNGVAATGSPVWMDTFDVAQGEVWEVALKADNPGVWMDHCHNLRHAAEGMVFHLTYEGVTTPYRMEGRNHPE